MLLSDRKATVKFSDCVVFLPVILGFIPESLLAGPVVCASQGKVPSPSHPDILHVVLPLHLHLTLPARPWPQPKATCVFPCSHLHFLGAGSGFSGA